ncbi:hypothetical protein AB0I52_25675 [Streptomyces sp. NPDC050423]|uniref:hypothetical protein n=1 Tax=Streptomyces sp. NPDC050423 TaxID=3155402 RepID=UPI003436877B
MVPKKYDGFAASLTDGLYVQRLLGARSPSLSLAGAEGIEVRPLGDAQVLPGSETREVVLIDVDVPGDYISSVGDPQALDAALACIKWCPSDGFRGSIRYILATAGGPGGSEW